MTDKSAMQSTHVRTNFKDCVIVCLLILHRRILDSQSIYKTDYVTLVSFPQNQDKSLAAFTLSSVVFIISIFETQAMNANNFKENITTILICTKSHIFDMHAKPQICFSLLE